MCNVCKFVCRIVCRVYSLYSYYVWSPGACLLYLLMQYWTLCAIFNALWKIIFCSLSLSPPISSISLFVSSSSLFIYLLWWFGRNQRSNRFGTQTYRVHYDEDGITYGPIESVWSNIHITSTHTQHTPPSTSFGMWTMFLLHWKVNLFSFCALYPIEIEINLCHNTTIQTF